MPDDTPVLKDRGCDNCGRWIDADELMYCVRIDVYAEPRMPVIDPGKGRGELAAEWDCLVRRLESMDETAAQEASDQVHEVTDLRLCAECRGELHRRIARRRDIL